MINIELDLETERLKAKVREADEKGHTDASVAAGIIRNNQYFNCKNWRMSDIWRYICSLQVIHLENKGI